ncbi:MAG: hypothetical protein QXE79_00195 [Candidatus Bathyarchaeia archaeon]
MDLTLKIICTPSLRSSLRRLVEYLEGDFFDRLLLPFPEALNPLLIKFINGEESFDELLEEASGKGCILEPTGYFKYLYEPLIRAMPILKRRLPRLDITCYRDSESIAKMNELAVHKASLTLYTAINGKVKIREWRGLFEEELKSDTASIHEAVNNIIRSYNPFSHVICAAHLEGRHLYERLRGRIRSISLKYMGLPYFYTPLEALKRLISIKGLSGVTDEAIEEGVKLHVGYVRDYVIPSKELDMGYLRWLIKNFKIGDLHAKHIV